MFRRSVGWGAISAVAVVLLACLPTASHADRQTMALFNLRPMNIEAMGYNTDILFTLASVLDGNSRIEVIQRRRMEDSLYQVGLGQSDEPDAVLQAGRALRVAFVLFGRVRYTGDTVHADLHLMDIGAGKEAGTWQMAIAGRDAVTGRMNTFAQDLMTAVDRASSRAVVSAAPAAAAAQAAPTSITLLHFTAQSQGDHVALAWRAPDPESLTGYHVYRATNPDGPFQLLGQSSGPKFADATARAGLTYYYQIGLISDIGAEIRADATASVAHTAERRPHPPLVLGIEGFVQRVRIRFVPSLVNEQERFDIKAYKVYRRDSTGGDFEAVSVSEPSRGGFGTDVALTVTDRTGLVDGHSYIYVITSVDADGIESSYSDPATTMVAGRPGLSVHRDRLLRRVEFDIQPVPGAAEYRLYRRPDNQTAFKRVGRTDKGDGAGGLVDEYDLQDGKTYVYYLTAADDQAETGPSESVTARTKVVPPPPAKVTAEPGLVKAVRLAWTPVADEDVGGYAIYRGTTPEDLEGIKRLRGHQTDGYLDKGHPFIPLKDGTTYYYQVKSYNRFDAEGPPSVPVSAQTKPRPAAVTGIVAKLVDRRIQLTWQANAESDIAAYLIFRQKNDGFWSRHDAVGPAIMQWQDGQLSPDTRYRYRIIAKDADELESDPSESETILTPASPP